MSDRARPQPRHVLAAVVLVVIALFGQIPAVGASPEPSNPPGPAPVSVPGDADHPEGPPFDPRNAQFAPEIDGGAGAAADPRAFVNPGWLPLRGQQRLGCVTTNCNGGGHSLWAIDISFASNEPIYASGSGRVYLTVTNQGANCDQATHPSPASCPNGAQGNAVLIDHGNNVYSFYGHLKKVAVQPGQMVTDGTMIASAGNSGWTPPTFVHVHYEEWQGLTWAGGVRTRPRPLKACHGSTTQTYPNAGGSTDWNGLPGFGVWLRHDGKCNPNGPTCITGFYDVPSTHGFCAPVSWMVNSDITNGYGDNLYHPERTVSRQSAVAWMYRMAGSPSGTFPSPGFSDVPSNHQFRREIAWAVSEGIVTGYPDGTFRGSALVTRAGFAAFLHRMAGAPQGPFPDPRLSDVTPSVPFYLEISWAIDEGVAKGYEDNTFRRGDNISRQGGSAFLWRFDRDVL